MSIEIILNLKNEDLEIFLEEYNKYIKHYNKENELLSIEDYFEKEYLITRKEFEDEIEKIVKIANSLLKQIEINENIETFPEEWLALQAIVNMTCGNNYVVEILKVLLNKNNDYTHYINAEEGEEGYKKNGYEIKNIDYDDNSLFIDLKKKVY